MGSRTINEKSGLVYTHNEEFRDLYRVSNIVMIVTSENTGWVRHIDRVSI